MAPADQVARQRRVLRLLERFGRGAVEAAQELECTVRTVYRDLRVTNEASAPIYHDLGAAHCRSLSKTRMDRKQHGSKVVT